MGLTVLNYILTVIRKENITGCRKVTSHFTDYAKTSLFQTTKTA